MGFLRSKSEQLAEHLRASIQRGELVDPLPGIRAWSQQLGVSRRTVQEALWKLQREGILTVGRRGIRLCDALAAGRTIEGNATRRVRLLYYEPTSPNLLYDLEWIETCSERLHQHGIQLGVEKCNAARLLAIAAAKPARGELLFLLSLPERYQRRFQESGHPCLLLGRAAPGVTLPFITLDQSGAIRHATQTLLRKGHNHLCLILPRTKTSGGQQDVDAFQKSCEEWPRQPVRTETVLVSLDTTSLTDAARRFASRVNARVGVVVTAPVPVGLIMSALQHGGIKIGNGADLIALFHPLESVKLVPPPIHYPYPTKRLAKELSTTALHYFEQSAVPPIRKLLLAELARSDS